MILAQKYRPRKLSDLVGQDVVVQTLSNAMQHNKLHHAYLFVGNFGSGKTSASRILAAMENCERPQGTSPCGECTTCKKIFAGEHTDVKEIDAASSAGKVEQVRELKKTLMYSPITNIKTKYIIMDEAHSLTAAAAEALLKMIEEPPPNVRFIFCTTELESMTDTILSRCQVHDFKKIYWRLIADHLVTIAKYEGIQYEKEAIELCARMSKGSMRDALQNLDKLCAYAGHRAIGLQDAHKIFSTTSELVFYDLIDEILGVGGSKPDATRAYQIINDLIINGVSFEFIYNELCEKLRHLLVTSTASHGLQFVSVSEQGKVRLKEQVLKCSSDGKLDSLKSIIEELQRARKNYREYNQSPEMVLQQWVVASMLEYRTPRT